MSRLQRFTKLSISPLVVPSLVLFSAFQLAAQQTPQEPVHAPDGRTIERIQSIDVPTIPNAPFSAVVVTNWTLIMPDGSLATIKNHRNISRDSAGRVYEERRIFTPTGDVQQTRLRQIDIRDPNSHKKLVCDPQTLVCHESNYQSLSTLPPLQPAGILPNHTGSLTREDLGHKSEGNLDLVGTREVMTINAGVIGNQNPQPVVKEFWFSPRLGINVITKRFDPRASANQTFQVININQSEPDPTTLQPPANYRIIKEQ